MSNSVNLSLDVTKAGIQNPLIKVRQGDGGFETLHTTVTSNGEPLDLQGWTITFMGTTAGNHKMVDGNVKIVEAPNGIFDYTPSKAWGMDIGEFKIAYFKFVKGDGSASSANFRVNVIEAVDLTQEEAQNYISVVDTTITEINQRLTDSLSNVTQSIADANANANTVASDVNSLGDRVDDYNNKLAAVQVGGRNIAMSTRDFSGGNFTSLGTLTPNDFQGLTSSSSSSQYSGPRYIQLVDSKSIFSNQSLPFIASIWVNNTGTSPVDINFYGSNISTQNYKIVTLQANSGWIRVKSNPFNSRAEIGQSIVIRFSNTSDVQGGVIKQAGFKLEFGNVPTDWTTAPEDAPSNDAQLVHKTGTENIAGDKTFTSPINGQLSGNAATATKWQTARTLALNGDVTGSVAMDGAGNVSMATTGANLVHKTGTETIAGDKTFTGSVKFLGAVETQTVTNNGVGMTFKKFGNVVTVSGSGNYSGSNVNPFSTISSNVVPSGFLPSGIVLVNANWGSNIGQMGFDASGAWLHRGGASLSNSWVVISGVWSV